MGTDCFTSKGAAYRAPLPFCPGSSSKLTQSIVKDHMVSHYKKIYSAKSAIDATVPKSLIHSVKYKDQLKREQLRRGGRPQSAHSVLQGDGRDSRSSKESRGSLQGESSPFFCSGSSLFSTPRHNTSFHAKQVVYPSHGSRSLSHHHLDTASEFSFRRSEPNLYRQHSSALGTSQSPYTTFKDPVQKTYGGDLLHKHSHYFTQDKPFTPRTLKSDKSSSLSKYRYYTAPKRNPNPDPTNSSLMQPQTNHRRRELKQHSTLDYDDQPQGFSTDHGWSEDESIDPHVSLSTNQREDELVYLEFMVNVSDDILSRGLFSDRVLDRVFERHIDRNRRRLNEGKMRHLLEVLRKDLEDTGNTPTRGSAETTEKHPLHKHLSSPTPGKSRQSHTKEEERDLSLNALLGTNRDSPTRAVSSSTPSHRSSPEHADSAIDTKLNLEEFQPLEVTVPDWLNDNRNKYAGINNEDLTPKPGTSLTDTEDLSQEQHESTALAGGDALHLDPVEDGRDGLSKELEDLGRTRRKTRSIVQEENQKEKENQKEEKLPTDGPR
ncbi:Spermatogenesis-associated protein 7 [Merluccius polli]|uniref:Spermatogenesis-associated protein 7 n=1 Tax=Merluccius polli TaxID=89951 RepID=A0AA47M7C1_MERPO|nr:Spermatogenesis-associated protein 7 [Merluccius polli]